MKANPRSRVPAIRTLTITALSALPLLAGCSTPPPKPEPTPVPAASSRPASMPAPAPVPPLPDWRDRTATPGDWSWKRSTTGSDAVFASGQFIMHCNPAQQTVTLLRGMPGAGGPVQMTVRTSETARALTAVPVAGGAGVTLAARDPLLDAMAFSRGRFAVEVPGSAPLYIPSWAEVSRVIEDCR